MISYTCFWSTSKTCFPLLTSRITIAFPAILTGIFLCYNLAWADEVCGPENVQYVEKVAAEMQQFASKVTKTGNFSIREEYPGDGTALHVISFVDHRKTFFIFRVADFPLASATIMRPSKIIGSYPGLIVLLVQGSIGSCEYNVLFRNAKFIAESTGLKR